MKWLFDNRLNADWMHRDRISASQPMEAGFTWQVGRILLAQWTLCKGSTFQPADRFEFGLSWTQQLKCISLNKNGSGNNLCLLLNQIYDRMTEACEAHSNSILYDILWAIHCSLKATRIYTSWHVWLWSTLRILPIIFLFPYLSY